MFFLQQLNLYPTPQIFVRSGTASPVYRADTTLVTADTTLITADYAL